MKDFLSYYCKATKKFINPYHYYFNQIDYINLQLGCQTVSMNY